MKIGIVGMGWVGASVAASVLKSGFATELLAEALRVGSSGETSTILWSTEL